MLLFFFLTLFLVVLPGIGFLHVVDLALHVLEHFFLQWSEAAIDLQRGFVSGDQAVYFLSQLRGPQELPLGQTFRLLDGAEGIALESDFSMGASGEVFTFTALNHLEFPLQAASGARLLSIGITRCSLLS